MSHCMGARCGVCKEILDTVQCPEGCGVHGWSDVEPSEWAASRWPEHGCLAVSQ